MEEKLMGYYIGIGDRRFFVEDDGFVYHRDGTRSTPESLVENIQPDVHLVETPFDLSAIDDEIHRRRRELNNKSMWSLKNMLGGDLYLPGMKKSALVEKIIENQGAK